MSKRPQNAPPPGRPTPAHRSAKPPPYKRPVQSPDAETVMLAKVRLDKPKPQDNSPPGIGRTGKPAPPGVPFVEEDPGVSTRILSLPRSKRAGPAQWSAPSARRTWVSRAILVAICCVQAALSLRMHNTASGNEALYLYAGHMEIGNLFHGSALQGNYASYFPGVPTLYPVLGAAVSAVGGLAAARGVSLLAMLVTTVFLYAMSRRLFNERVALCGAALFGVAESAIFTGNQATNDAPALALLALAAWIVVRTASWRWRAYLLAAPVAALAAATDYWALLCLPTLALLAGLAAHPHQGRSGLARALVLGAVTLELLAVTLIVTSRVFLTGVGATIATRTPGSAAAQILSESGSWGGLLLAVAVVGAVAYALRPRTEPNEYIALPGTRRRRIALGIALIGTALVILADQLYLNNDGSLGPHLSFGLFFAAPMAGLGLARLVGDHFRRAQIGIVVWAAALVLGLGQATQMFGSWPDSSAQVGELSRFLAPGGRYLVEDDNVSMYYLMGRKDAQPDQFTSTYFIAYPGPDGKTLTGMPGFLAAIRAGYFQVIIYDGTVTPGLDKSIAAALENSAEYRLAGAVPENARDFKSTCYIWVRS
jgi:hypothetical protein